MINFTYVLARHALVLVLVHLLAQHLLHRIFGDNSRHDCVFIVVQGMTRLLVEISELMSEEAQELILNVLKSNNGPLRKCSAAVVSGRFWRCDWLAVVLLYQGETSKRRLAALCIETNDSGTMGGDQTQTRRGAKGASRMDERWALLMDYRMTLRWR